MHQLERLRTKQELSVEELASRAGVAIGTVLRVERCGRLNRSFRVKDETAEGFRQALNVHSPLDIFRSNEITCQGRHIGSGGVYNRRHQYNYRTCAQCGMVAAMAVSSCENCGSTNLIAKIA